MLAQYPAVYRDASGEEATVITNDGTSLTMTVRGVTFVGQSFDDFTPTVPFDSPALASFTLNRYCEDAAELCACFIEFPMPLPVFGLGGVIDGTLTVQVELGAAGPRGGIEVERFTLTLRMGADAYASDGSSGWFEDELLQIQRALPEPYYMLACINCAFSDYSIYGHGAFGYLDCFRNLKDEYLAVRTKTEYEAI
ncbi:MAG: DUF6304 family protein, partial [Chloroflexi bacterium]|nr:DUF6304 family protein [Chloroflexota bacterium]